MCRAIADVIFIYPLKKDKKTFDSHKEELGFSRKPKRQRKNAIEDFLPDRLTDEQRRHLEQEELQLKSKLSKSIGSCGR